MNEEVVDLIKRKCFNSHFFIWFSEVFHVCLFMFFMSVFTYVCVCDKFSRSTANHANWMKVKLVAFSLDSDKINDSKHTQGQN